MTDKPSSKKRFLNTPKYPGGSQAFREFISRNLQYPKEAIEKGIQGTVIVGYDVRDTGEVSNLHIIKGLGYGCDEEALRLISLLKFEKVKNRGLRLKMSTKTTIHFRLPGVVITYQSSGTKPTENEAARQNENYSYTITF